MCISAIGAGHLEQLSRVAAAVTIDPVRKAVQCFFPYLEVFFQNYQELQVDRSLAAGMPLVATGQMLIEISRLARAAGVEATPYVAFNHTFSSAGGKFSITMPALLIPVQHLFRSEHSPFPQERPDENLAGQKWLFSDNETRFLIARELGQIQMSSSLIQLAIKVALLAAAFVMFATSLGFWGGIALFAGAACLHILSENYFQGEADIVGAQILARAGCPNAKAVAIATLEKMRQQNLYRRENSSFARVCILESGDHLLDLMHPFLTTRIERLRHCEENLLQA